MAAFISRNVKSRLKSRKVAIVVCYPSAHNILLSSRDISPAVSFDSKRYFFDKLSGLREINSSQNKVTHREAEFVDSLERTYRRQSRLSSLWTKLNSKRATLHHTSTVIVDFPPLLVEELRLLKLEKLLSEDLWKHGRDEEKRYESLWDQITANQHAEKRRTVRRAALIVIACLVGSLIGASATMTSQYLWDYFFVRHRIHTPDQSEPESSLRHLIIELSNRIQTTSANYLTLRSNLQAISSTNLPRRNYELNTTEFKMAAIEEPSYETVDVEARSVEMHKLLDELKTIVTAPSAAGLTVVSPQYMAGGADERVEELGEVMERAEDEEEVEEEEDLGVVWKLTLFYGLLALFVPVAGSAFS